MTVARVSVEQLSVEVAGGRSLVGARRGTAPRTAAADDVIAVPANAHELAERLGDRVEVHTIDGAGHALLPERPDEVSALLIDWLARVTDRSRNDLSRC